MQCIFNGIAKKAIAIASTMAIISGLTLASPTAWSREVRARVTYRDVGSKVTTESLPITEIRGRSGCSYELQLRDGNRIQRPLTVGADFGTPQRVTDPSCRPPAFTSTMQSNQLRFESQTAYAWALKARDYARRRIWVKPPGWSGPPIKLSYRGVHTNIARDGFAKSCYAGPGRSVSSTLACMRAWPHEGPRIHIRTGKVTPNTMVHEFGHYAAGYVTGQQDAIHFTANLTNCMALAYQEAIAEMFEHLVFHDARYEATLKNAVSRAHNAQYTGRCLPDEHHTARPLEQAFKQALWGKSADGSIQLAWPSRDVANRVMAGAFVTALWSNRGYRMDDMATDIVGWIKRTQNADVSRKVEAIFRSHGFATRVLEIGDRCASNSSCNGDRTSRCDTTVSPRQCIPDDGWGKRGEYCSHNNHCDPNSRLLCQLKPGKRYGTCQ